MPNCHQCNQVASVNTRDGNCSICFAQGVTYCASCAMWELGPNTTTANIFADLTTSPVPRSISVPRQQSGGSDQLVASVAELPLECPAFFAALSDACDYVRDQLDDTVVGPGPFNEVEPNKTQDEDDWKAWFGRCVSHANRAHPAKLYGKSFKAYACSVLDKFRELYPTCKYDRVALQVLLMMHLGAQERIQCRFAADSKPDSYRDDVKYLKRWQIRTVAVAHLRAHLGDVGDQFGTDVQNLVTKKTWRDALGLDDFELFIKGRKPPTLFAIDLLALAGSADAARETLEIAIILYHALTATRPKDELENHWSQKTQSFVVHDCLGLLAVAHYEELYGDGGDGTSFCDATKTRLNQVWQVLGDTAATNSLPTHPRFPDVNVPTTLQAVEQNYLQYLPTFDHLQANADQRSECERVVRARVVPAFKAYYDAYLKGENMIQVEVMLTQVDVAGASSTTSRSIKIEAPNQPKVEIQFKKLHGESHISVVISAAQQLKLDTLITNISTHTYLQANGPTLVIKVTYDRGNDRRRTRRDAVVNAIQAGLESGNGKYWLEYSRDTNVVGHDGTVVDSGTDVEDATDALIEVMQKDLYVDQCFDDSLARLLITRNDVVPKAWFPLKLQAKRWSEIFPDCGFDTSTVHCLDEHYAVLTGSSPRGSHYVDWRNHKDLWLYDGFQIDARRRPLFCALSVQPIVPEPNPNYGSHTLLFKRSTTRHRSIHTFGDKQQPRRSMLLLLDDILYEHQKKDGSDGQSAKNRTKPADDLFRRFGNIATQRTKTLAQQWTATVAGPPISYPDGDLLIECQILGPIVPLTDLHGVVMRVESRVWMTDMKLQDKWFFIDETDAAAKQLHLTTHYGSELLAYKPSRHHAKYAPGVRPEPTKIRPEDREGLLDKKAQDNADVP
jgi:hypothetical protein